MIVKYIICILSCVMMSSCAMCQHYEDMSASSLINNTTDSRIQVGKICSNFLDGELSEAQAVYHLNQQKEKLVEIKPYLDKEIELLRTGSKFHKMCFEISVYSYQQARLIPLISGHQAQEKLHLTEYSNIAVNEALSNYDGVLSINYRAHIYSDVSLSDIILQERFEQAIQSGELDKVRQMLQKDEEKLWAAEIPSSPPAPIQEDGETREPDSEKIIERYLTLAIKSDNPAMLSFFLQKRPDVNAPIGIYDITLLIEASKTGKFKIVEYLLNNGAKKSINKISGLGKTALMEAACHGYPQIMELLLKYGADINTANQSDDTALEIAVSCEQVSCVTLLLSYSNQIRNLEKRLRRCLNIAKNIDNKEIEGVLLQRN